MSSTRSTPRPRRQAYDAVVIGGGPGGSTASTLLARHGLSVLQLERKPLPRFKIGESLIPATYDVLRRLGMLDRLRASAFPKKYSVQFISEDGRASAPFYFSETDPSERSQTWQVLRGDFDRMLLDNARQAGVEVLEGVAVRDVLFDGEPAAGARARGVRLELADGRRADVASRVVVDASGRSTLLAKKLGLRRPDPHLKMAALFTHFEGAVRDAGRDEGATLVIHVESKAGWVWYIPLPDDRVSVGIVGPIDYLVSGRRGDPQKVFDEEIARCPGVRPRLAPARQVMDVQVLKNFSYQSSRVAGDGWVLVGDAYAFLDPIYSTGVLLAFKSGELAADAIAAALAADDPSAARLGVFGPTIERGMEAFRGLVYAFYDRRFSFARFLKRHPEHRQAVIDILVGDVFDRDFGPLYADMERMLPGLRPSSPAQLASVAGVA
ncbi:MAG: NAD(P)/FAD-dependent oxidoreductase [Acidobacteria bacterium]|nr:MAG: NAD(P)/FAD-dependent oxidoreductase [Acidobacteriota bacterium]